MKYDKNQILDKFDNAKKVLIGIGNEFSVLDDDGNYNENKAEEVLAAYNVMAKKLGEKDYYILTLCTDDLIYKSKLDSDRIVAPCGSIGKFQCPKGCDHKIYDEQKETCSVCGESLVPNTVICPQKPLPAFLSVIRFIACSLLRLRLMSSVFTVFRRFLAVLPVL